MQLKYQNKAKAILLLEDGKYFEGKDQGHKVYEIHKQNVQGRSTIQRRSCNERRRSPTRKHLQPCVGQYICPLCDRSMDRRNGQAKLQR